MGANRGHQLGLRLRTAPLPGRLHPGGSCERLDRAEHPGVTAQWLPRPGRRREGKRHAGRPPSPRGVQVAGGGPAGGRVQFYCIFHSNKEPFVPSLLVHHLHVTAKTTHLEVTRAQRWGRVWEVSKGSGRATSPKPHLWGWGFSLVFKAPFCVNAVPLVQNTQQHRGERGERGGD